MNIKWIILPALALAACGERKDTPATPQTPQEMYEHVRALLQPNVEHDASDFEQALHWLRRAAEAGNLQAQTDLGGIYLEGGKGVQADAQQARHWFSMAAAQGSKEALYYLGFIQHSQGDREQAMEYWQKAAEAGVAEAQYILGIEQARAQDAPTARQGVEWLRRAVSQAATAPATAAKAACALGYVHAAGRRGIQADMAEASRWYKLAADGGDAAAQLVCAIMMLKGEGMKRDEKQGMSYLRLSAGQDHAPAIRLLISLLRAVNGDSSHEQEIQAWEQRLRNAQQQPAVNEAQTGPAPQRIPAQGDRPVVQE